MTKTNDTTNLTGWCYIIDDEGSKFRVFVQNLSGNLYRWTMSTNWILLTPSEISKMVKDESSLKSVEEYFQEFYNEVRYQIEQDENRDFIRANEIWNEYESSK